MNAWRQISLLVVSLYLGGSLGAAEWNLADMVGKDASGRVVFRAKPIDDRFRNAIPAAEEDAFQARARAVIEAQGKMKVAAGNTYFENEKRTYGYLMAQVLAGRAGAISDLQLEDAQAKEWHRETSGIDFFACFTLKHQVRKFFYFGEMLSPEYRDRMRTGAKSFTSQDPLKRAHSAFKAPGPGWGPDQKNSWVDVRSTENLYLMRVTSVYLFAEATGNTAVAAKYKEEFRRYAKALYRVGIGEWDSENYHGHSIGPLCNLYDFASDAEVKLLAKACLDWFFAAGAVKYYRGAFNGPTKRDYNHAQPFGGSAANMLWLAFGDAPLKQGDWESDEVHLITSAYRPPAAVLKLAHKHLQRPLEIFASKPPYSATTSGDAQAKPEFAETHYFGHSFQMGSLASGTSEDGGDVNGFKIVAFDSQRGAIAIQGVPGGDPVHVGSPAYKRGVVSGPNRVAQLGNLAIWIAKDGKSPWRWVLPATVKVSQEKGVTFLEAERTWVALRPLGSTSIEADSAGTKQVSEGEKPPFAGHQVLSAKGTTEQFCGVAVEIGERESHGDFASFRQKVLAAKVDVSKLSEGVVQYQAADGKWLGFHWNDDPWKLGVWKNGKRHDWEDHARYLYRRADSAAPGEPLFAPWESGKLYVEAGGEAFFSEVSDEGQANSVSGKPAELRARIAN